MPTGPPAPWPATAGDRAARPNGASHYATAYAKMEKNSTFYRLPARDTLADWRARTPADFVMAIKASRYLTHVKRLRDAAEPVAHLIAAGRSAAGRERRAAIRAWASEQGIAVSGCGRIPANVVARYDAATGGG